MNKSKLYIHMLGEISITWNGRSITEKDSRSRKIWLLLAYLICERRRHIPQEEIINLLWDGEEQSNPQGSLKTALHRLRSMLNHLDPEAGHELIVRKDNTYAWNTDYELDLDAEIFETLCRESEVSQDEDTILAHCLQIQQQYQGDFLPSLRHETWVAEMASAYHELYLKIIFRAIGILQKRGQTADVAAVCRQALKIDPYNEELYEYLLESLLELNLCEEAADAYEALNRHLLASMGIMPAERLRSLYWKALRTDNSYTVPVDEISRQLQEGNSAAGALFCEYDFFKVLYQSQARAITRTEESCHLGILSVKARPGKTLSRSSLDLAMQNLQEVICKCVRRGDVATRCSATQFIIMLPRADYENSCKVCNRIIRAFCRQYPHSPAEITFHVLPVIPA